MEIERFQSLEYNMNGRRRGCGPFSSAHEYIEWKIILYLCTHRREATIHRELCPIHWALNELFLLVILFLYLCDKVLCIIGRSEAESAVYILKVLAGQKTLKDISPAVKMGVIVRAALYWWRAKENLINCTTCCVSLRPPAALIAGNQRKERKKILPRL